MVICHAFKRLAPLPPCRFHVDGSDLDTVSHGSLDSTNDSAEHTSIDTDFTKMDSSDDGLSTGKGMQRYSILVFPTISEMLLSQTLCDLDVIQLSP